jgi:hypothetical protein
MAIENVPRCQHLKTNGVQCMSPALKWRRLCFFHNRIQRARKIIAKDESTQRRFDLPLLEDANSVQMALMKVIQMLGSGRLDHRTAGLMLYALQTAACNLRNVSFEPSESTDVVIDRDDIHRTCIGGPQWLEEDFENEEGQREEEEASVEDEAEGNDVEEDESEDEAEKVAEQVAGGEEVEKIRPRGALKQERVSIEEARKQVQGVIYDWIGETQAGAGSNPG